MNPPSVIVKDDKYFVQVLVASGRHYVYAVQGDVGETGKWSHGDNVPMTISKKAALELADALKAHAEALPDA